MRITGVRTRESPSPAEWIVELSTDADLTGIGIATRDVRGLVGAVVDELLRGEDPRAATSLWQRMTEACGARLGRGGPAGAAVAVLDLALWDLKAKAQDEPLWKTLGGSRPRVNAYASCTDPFLDEAALGAWFRSVARDHGFTGGKLVLGADPDADARRLAVMREALAARTAAPALMVDFGVRQSPKESIRAVRALERQLDLTWVEGVAAESDFLGLKRVSSAVRAAVCGGAQLTALADFLPHFHHHSLDVVEIDVGFHGITGAMQLADAAFGFELPVTLAAAPGNVQAQLGGAMPYVMSTEVLDPGPGNDAFATDVRIEGGSAIAGDAPGNGLRIRGERPANGGGR